MDTQLPVLHGPHQPARRDPAPAAHRRRQVRLVRRLPADPPRPRGRAARDRRARRRRRVRRGDLASVGRSVRRALRRGLGQHRRSRRRRSSGCGPSRIARDRHRRVRDRRRHPGHPQLVRPRGRPRRGLPAADGYVESLATVAPGRDFVAVDGELRGCPISPGQLREFLVALVTGRRAQLPDEAVCLECKRRGTVCVAVARGIPCLGPVTRTGCGALCPAYGRGCYGCFGPRESANTASLARWLSDERSGSGGRPPVRRVHRLVRAVPVGHRRPRRPARTARPRRLTEGSRRCMTPTRSTGDDRRPRRRHRRPDPGRGRGIAPAARPGRRRRGGPPRDLRGAALLRAARRRAGRPTRSSTSSPASAGSARSPTR